MEHAVVSQEVVLSLYRVASRTSALLEREQGIVLNKAALRRYGEALLDEHGFFAGEHRPGFESRMECLQKMIRESSVDSTASARS